ncbi:hypothetical protein [Spartinivicinus poritis]|uniref:Photosystem I assembly protein Ycf4 n=1 Tax=Spartinivicinus poritis TaxID=2994640 RepID=A0ABT5UC33_9GAMM|nr:hypothetical protein [Spartinivicinus sp. A2-2]MDE1463546.1 hypothetical protein [Spartinivicinus sp. A2-2]
MPVNKYEYRFKNRVILFLSLLMVAGFFYQFFLWSIDPNYVVEIKGIVLSKTAGLVFLCGILIFLLAGIVFITLALITTFIHREIVVSNDAILTPQYPWSTKVIEMNSENIKSYKIETVKSNQTLIVKTHSGTARISKVALPSSVCFDEICEEVHRMCMR